MDPSVLPDDILRLVLKACVQHHRSNNAMQTFKGSLPLLAVCQRWRRLASSVVYSNVFIEHSTRPSVNGGSGGAGTSTNLDLAAAVGRVGAVKGVTIGVHYLESPFLGFGSVVKMMHGVATVWRGVRAMTLVLNPDPRSRPERVMNGPKYREGIQKFSAALADTMPGVLQIKLCGKAGNPVARDFGGELAGRFSEQLHVLQSWNQVVPPAGCVFRQLRQVSLGHDRWGGYHLPRIDPATLVRLAVHNWPLGRSWAPFSADDKAGEIEFPSLRTLCIFYRGADTEHPDTRVWQLRFPALKIMRLYSPREVCPLLQHAVLPAHMDAVSIRVTGACVRLMSSSALPAVGRFRIHILDNDTGLEVLDAVNRISVRMRPREEATLDVNSIPSSGIPALASLTKLVVRAPTGVDTMLALIQALPGLTGMIVWHLALDNIQADISVPGPAEARVVEPLGTRIEAMTLSVGRQPGMRRGKLAAVVKHLLLRIPTLRSLVAAQVPAEPIAYFVSAFVGRYPHLAAVNLRVGQGL